MDMRLKMLIILLLAGSLVLLAAGQAEAKTYPVSMQNSAFNPKEITIFAGDTITWTNNDAMLHDVDIQGLGESPDLRKGETYSMTFDKPGTYSYICGIHPSMKGTVIVK